MYLGGTEYATLEYQSWDPEQLQAWLKEHSINVPKGYSQQQLQDLVKSNWAQSASWTQDKYDAAQKVFSNIKDDSFQG